jgi:hypothetical protein
MSTTSPLSDEHERAPQEARVRIRESDWAFIPRPWLGDALREAATHTLLVAALLSGLMLAAVAAVAAPAGAHTASPAARGLTIAQAESATRAALAPLAVDSVYCFRGVSPDPQSSRRRALCLVAHLAPEGQICRSLVEVKRSRAHPSVIRTQVIAGQFCMRFDPRLSRPTAAAAAHTSAVSKSAQVLARQARRELEATPHVSVLSMTLQWRTKRLCDVLYVLRQRGELMAYAGQIQVDSRGQNAHFRGLTGLRRI